MSKSTVIIRESQSKSSPWRQIVVVTDARVAIVDMVPALFGWNLGKVTVQTSEDWGGLSHDEILAWKRSQSWNECDTLADPAAFDAGFRAKLSALVEVSL